MLFASEHTGVYFRWSQVQFLLQSLIRCRLKIRIQAASCPSFASDIQIFPPPHLRRYLFNFFCSFVWLIPAISQPAALRVDHKQVTCFHNLYANTAANTNAVPVCASINSPYVSYKYVLFLCFNFIKHMKWTCLCGGRVHAAHPCHWMDYGRLFFWSVVEVIWQML
jgi:hypothetical protein